MLVKKGLQMYGLNIFIFYIFLGIFKNTLHLRFETTLHPYLCLFFSEPVWPVFQ